MYLGDNETAIQSQSWIVDAVIELMKEKRYRQITIKDICQKADLSRQTFYNLFNDKDEVLRFCLRKSYEKVYEMQSKRSTVTIEDAASAFAQELTEDKELIWLMINHGLENIVTDEIARCVKLFATRFFAHSSNDRILPYQEAFVSGALSQIMIVWFKAENPVSIQEITQIILGICSGNFFQSQK